MFDPPPFRFDKSMRNRFGDALVDRSAREYRRLSMWKRVKISVTTGAEVWCIQWCKDHDGRPLPPA